MMDQNKKHNICGALVMALPEDHIVVESYLHDLVGCEIVEKNLSSFAVVVEDNALCSAYDVLEKIKDHTGVASITLINHFFE